MSYNVHVRPRARRHLSNIYVELELAREGLGVLFDAEFDEQIERLAENPFQFPEHEHPIRRFLVGRFPYKAFFTVRRNVVAVLAVFHAHSDPTKWPRP